MKLEIVVDASGLPLGLAAAAANVSECKLAILALDEVPVSIPEGTPVLADRGHDSDPLHEDLQEHTLEPILPHRRSRVRPSRHDVRRLRRYRRRYLIERTNVWLLCYRSLAVRWASYSFMYVGLVYTAFFAIALKRF